MIDFEENNYLIHYGVKGQKRGHRRWQNEDGSLTEEGKIHYGIGGGERRRGKVEDNDQRKQKKELTPEEREARKKKVKKILAITAGVTLAAAAGYMAYRIGDQWTKNLQEEYQNQAIQRRNGALRYQEYAKSEARKSKDKAWEHSRRLIEGGKHYEGRSYDVRRRSAEVRDALDYSKIAKEYGKSADRYLGLYKNVTRQEAVRNFIKNKGSIVVPYIY